MPNKVINAILIIAMLAATWALVYIGRLKVVHFFILLGGWSAIIAKIANDKKKQNK